MESSGIESAACGIGLAVVGSAPVARFPEYRQLFREVAGSPYLHCGE